MSTRMKDRIAEAKVMLFRKIDGDSGITQAELDRISARLFEVDTQPGLFEVEQMGRNGGASRPLGRPIKKVGGMFF